MRTTFAAPSIVPGAETRAAFTRRDAAPTTSHVDVAPLTELFHDAPEPIASEEVLAWALPPEFRELVMERRLQLIEDGPGVLRVFVRDFSMDSNTCECWAMALRDAYLSRGQVLRSLWINGRAYHPTQGENHGR